jgi:hypothetical protein
MEVYCQGGCVRRAGRELHIETDEAVVYGHDGCVMDRSSELDLYLNNSLLGSERDDPLLYSGLVTGRTGSFLHPHKSQQDLQAASLVAQRFRIRVHEGTEKV